MDTKKKRPFLLKLITYSLVIIAVIGWLRFYQSIFQWETLLRFGVQPGPWYSLVSGGLIGIAAGIGAVSSWFQLRWSRDYVRVSLAVLTLGWWMDYLIFSQSSIAFYNLPFRILGNAIYLCFVYGYYYLTAGKQLKGQKDEK